MPRSGGARPRVAGEARHVTHPLPAVVDPGSRVLLLGTMPSPLSRQNGFHYGNPQNRFWRVMAALWDEDVPPDVEGKRLLCRRHHLALDDVLLGCTIVGASDSSIRDPEPNDLRRVLGVAPIGRIFCTGSAAYALYQRYVRDVVHMPATKLPSTSPANARWRLDDLVRAYGVVRDAVEELCGGDSRLANLPK